MINIIRAAKSDWPEIMSVWEASVRATHKFLTEEDIKHYGKLILEQYLAEMNLYCVKNGGVMDVFMGVLDGKLEMLFVRPEAFGKGLGREMLGYAIKACGVDKVDVNEENPGALGFYKHMGFKVVGRTPVDSEGRNYPILHMELA